MSIKFLEFGSRNLVHEKKLTRKKVCCTCTIECATCIVSKFFVEKQKKLSKKKIYWNQSLIPKFISAV